MRRLPFIAWLLLASACGDDEEKKPTLTLERTRPLASLTAEERAMACDFAAASLGGYGKPLQCSDGARPTVDTQEECVTRLQAETCMATVGELEGCVQTIASCAPLTTLLLDPGCQRVLPCVR